MNYYIQGDAAKAQEIKAAFERLGYDVKAWSFTSGIYYTINGKIVNTNFGSNEYELVLNNPDYEELELPVEPKFNVGDKIQAKDSKMYVYTVLSVDLQNQKYTVEHNFKHQILFTQQDNFELVPPKPHYDIDNFHAGMPVLVRNSNDSKWYLSYYGFYDATMTVPFKFICINGESWKQCIPFNDDTKYLLGTTDMCDEQYINW